MSKDKNISKDQYGTPLEQVSSIIPGSSKFGQKHKQLVQYVSPDHDFMVQYPPITSIIPTTPVQNQFKPFTYQQVTIALPTSSKPVSIRSNAPTTITTRSSVPPLPRTPYVENPKLLLIYIIENAQQHESPRQTAQYIFLPNFEYLPTHLQKPDNTASLSLQTQI